MKVAQSIVESPEGMQSDIPQLKLLGQFMKFLKAFIRKYATQNC